MYEIVRSRDRYFHQNEGVSAYWNFSFGDYYDPRHVQFGPLRIFNDETMQPGAIFSARHYKNMEIVTYVIDGHLEHKDSNGSIRAIGPGEVQRMSAGTGAQHSEYNASQEAKVHFLKIWILPAVSDLEPEYEQKSFTEKQRDGTLLPIVSGMDHPEALKIHQDATLYIGRIQKKQRLVFETRLDRQSYLFVISGNIQVSGTIFNAGDSSKISEENALSLEAQVTSEVLLIDLP